jgi:hypothetical protein
MMFNNSQTSGGALHGVASLGAAPVVLNSLSDDYISDAVQGLGSSSVYTDSQASLANAGQIASDLNGSGVAVVSLPTGAFDTLGPSDVANAIGNKLGGKYNTVIVVNGNAVTTAGGNGNATQITTTINEAIAKGVSPGQAILSQAGQIKTLASGTKTSTGSGTGSSTDNGGDGGIVGLLGGGLLGIVVLGTLGVVAFKHLKQRPTLSALPAGQQTSAYVAVGDVSEHLPVRLRGLVKELDGLARKHSKIPGDKLAGEIHGLIVNLQELFERIQNKQGDTNNAALAAGEYENKIKKLNEALGEEYYLDIAQNPKLWDNPTERLQAVNDAVEAVEYQLVENIKQVNASKDLKFQVALDSLMGSKGPTVQEIYTTNPKKIEGQK